MIAKVLHTIDKYELLKKGDCVVVGLSGGPDSSALLAALSAIAPELNLKLIAAHFNHGLRGKESDGDEEFSRKLSKKLGVTFRAGKMKKAAGSRGVSPEDYYRRQRYAFFNKVTADCKAQKIALGHNMQDQAETVLLNLLRGSGMEGLKGILPKRDGNIIRPLIEVSRREIIAYLDENGISCRHDSSNESKIYLRNQVRAELIPYLKKYNPKIEETLAQTAQILRNEDEFIRQHVTEALASPFVQKGPDRVLLETGFANNLPQAVRWRLFKTLLTDFSPAKNGFSFVHIKSLDELSRDSEPGKRIILPLGVEARREYENLILEKSKGRKKKIQYEYPVTIPADIYVTERDITVRLKLARKKDIDLKNHDKVYLDLDKIKQPLILRNRKDGDWFVPLGMKGRQKVKNLFIDRKIPYRQRDEIILIVDGISVIFIDNFHLSDRVKITPETRNVLVLEITNT
jgi:tRNA(Ile)-lysidine synthase